MDCVIPGHSVRPFCSSIGCLSRIGKDLYLEFDVIEGLSLRTINDGKSAFACFRFESSFFERCTAPPLSSRVKKRRRESSQESESDEDRFSCRASLRALAAVVKPRKGVAGLRIKSEIISDALFLSFEFQIQHQDAVMTVVHRMKAADATGVTPVAPTDDASEMRGSPKVLLRLLEPLKNTNQAALVIRNDAQCVSASSFHHTDATSSQNAVLQATHASILKTETAVGCDEFYEFDFHQNRSREDDENMPEDVNSEVILVFSIKEAKSMLQYCSQSHLDHELDATLFFHWGGRPLVLDAKGDSLSARLVLATLDHELLKPLHGTQADN
ncbi:cell cycle checkpoint control protein RAD9A [Fistulifera solaris]|jgi:hypothetical protein|uniref:Cell cycle checkpoint control protein RAD9A n=1 Tax=Fistulifera solaris TaxID=1519565 RepID=A0A1Z5JM55_FISSO|nr:cell cycle checkpoint control protein RAD9A [Fistulifera solaris]|eukprot:GAX15103.1 cell cycle checkpoint control protein RAD9A [Fistulifera solaris]